MRDGKSDFKGQKVLNLPFGERPVRVFDSVDLAYQDVLRRVLTEGKRKHNRTGVDTLSIFGHSFSVDISERFPILTLKSMSKKIFRSMVVELLWYLSADHHIQELKKHTSIWNNWADEDLNLETAYGRFWRRYPIPDTYQQLPGEAWASGHSREVMEKYIREEVPEGGQRHALFFDQIAYILDTLKTSPYSRRMVLNAWHPANASVSKLPPCHLMAIFNVAPDEDGNPDSLNCHLTMRSSDVGLGLPFNIAQYSMLTYLLAQHVGLKPGIFAYSGVDVHLYVGDTEETRDYDQVSYAEEILRREPLLGPRLEIHKREDIDSYDMDDFQLIGYQSHPYLGMKCVP
jgi:thymidylate synthase